MQKKIQNRQTLFVGIFIYAFLLAAFLMTNSMLPETSLFPRMIIALFTLLNTIMVFQSFQGAAGNRMTLKEIKIPLLYFLGIVLYAFLFHYTNYFIATAVMLIAYMLILKVRPYWIIAAVTAAFELFVYLLFAVWLKTSII